MSIHNLVGIIGRLDVNKLCAERALWTSIPLCNVNVAAMGFELKMIQTKHVPTILAFKREEVYLFACIFGAVLCCLGLVHAGRKAR